ARSAQRRLGPSSAAMICETVFRHAAVASKPPVMEPLGGRARPCLDVAGLAGLLMIDRLRRFGTGFRGVFVLHAFLEGLDPLRDAANQLGNLPPPPEQQETDSNHHDPVPDAQ